MALCIYSGGDTGYEEKEKILEYLNRYTYYLVIMNSFYNRKKDPPLPVFVVKKVKNVWDLRFLTYNKISQNAGPCFYE